MAGRLRKGDEERLEDAFYDMSLADQDRMLDKLNLLHRLKRRNSSERFAAPAKDSEASVSGGTGTAIISTGSPSAQPDLRTYDSPLLDGLEVAVDIAGALKSALAVKRPPDTATILGEQE